MERCIDEVERFKKPSVGPNHPKDNPTPKIKKISFRNISSKTRIKIKKEEDIDEFLESLRKKLKEELGEDTEINLII